MKHKLIPLILSFILFMSTLQASAFGEVNFDTTVATSGYCGDTEEGNNEDLTWNYKNGTLTIGGTGAMVNFCYEAPDDGCINAPWYPLRGFIRAIKIKEGVETISSYAFADLYSLKTVSIPDTVQWIGNEAFVNCSSLEEIMMPDSVTGIGANAFSNCQGLQRITLSKKLQDIGYYAFAGCINLKELSIPDALTMTYWGTFYGCNGIETVRIGKGLVAEDLDQYAPETGAEFGFLNGLVDSKKLKSIQVEKGNTTLKAVDGVLFDVSGEILIRYPQQKPGTQYTIPDGVKIIFPGAFEGCARLEHIVFPDSLKYIREGAFCGCSNLQEIVIPDGAEFKSADDYAGYLRIAPFIDCVNLQKASVPDLTEYMFAGCKNLREVTIRTAENEEEWTWPEGAFLNCFNLKQINFAGDFKKTMLLPQAIKEIGERIIYGYDFEPTSVEGTDQSDYLPAMENKDVQMAELHEYKDEKSPYSEVYDAEGGILCLVHRDGSVTIAYSYELDEEEKDSVETVKQTVESWTGIKQVTYNSNRWTGENVFIGLKTDGTLVYAICDRLHESDKGYDRVSLETELDPILQWKDVASIALFGDGWGNPSLVVLKNDGSVATQDCRLSGRLSDWTDITDLVCWRSYGPPLDLHLKGSTRDGNVMSENAEFHFWLGSVDHVASIQYAGAAGMSNLMALNDNGTVVVTDGFAEIAYELSQWTDIKQIACFRFDESLVAVGLRDDGTVITTGGAFPVSRDWKDVRQLIADEWKGALYALTSDGNILETGNRVSHAEWKNVERLYCVNDEVIGITKDGRLISDFELLF